MPTPVPGAPHADAFAGEEAEHTDVDVSVHLTGAEASARSAEQVDQEAAETQRMPVERVSSVPGAPRRAAKSTARVRQYRGRRID